MPTYRYVCQACDHELEAFQSMTARALRKCPECGKPKLERQIGPGAGFLFKGDGFYITDYRSDGYKKAAEGEGKSGKKDAPDAKPAAKTTSETKKPPADG